MSRVWLGWGLAGLLLAGVLVGVLAVGDRSASADPVTAERSSQRSDVPHFDCDDRSTVPFEFSAERRASHVKWLKKEVEMNEQQVVSMTTVFDNASFRADEFWRQTRDNYCDLRDRLFSDVRAVLSEEQKRVLEEKVRRYERSEDSQAEGAADGKRP